MSKTETVLKKVYDLLVNELSTLERGKKNYVNTKPVREAVHLLELEMYRLDLTETVSAN